MYVSLKSMWNLMNVIQVIAYLRLFTNWPANTMMIKHAIYNAITLKLFSDELLVFVGLKNEDQTEKSRQEELDKVGI